MTWIVGVNSIMGYSFALSDIKVSWGNNFERDCLQKFYPITNNIGAGFAGSVQLGFNMLEALVECIKGEKNQRGNIPNYISQKWGRKAKYIFNNANPIDKKLGCNLIMIATFPESIIKTGPIGVPKTALIKLNAPNFIPYVAHQHEILSIGSGSYVEEYKNLLTWIDNNINEVWKFAEFIGLPAAFNILLTSQLQQYQRFGISKHMHIITADASGISIINNDRQSENGNFILKMPEVASGYDEFIKIAKGYGFSGTATG
jgi:hypothetical protein